MHFIKSNEIEAFLKVFYAYSIQFHIFFFVLCMLKKVAFKSQGSHSQTRVTITAHRAPLIFLIQKISVLIPHTTWVLCVSEVAKYATVSNVMVHLSTVSLAHAFCADLQLPSGLAAWRF